MIRTDRRTLLGGLAASIASAPLAKATAADPPFSFLVVGDWGRDGAQHQRDVAEAMGRAAAESGARFILSVGDNFYENVPGATLGMPEIDLFVIDTSPLVHQYREKVEAPIARNVATQDGDAQLAWLDGALAASPAAIKLVIGHHTLRSGGSAHGETPEIVQRVLPILRKNRVTAYINGHDHDLQHIRADGLDYLCCGAGSEVRPVKAVQGTQFCVSRSGFALVQLIGVQLNAEFRDYEGRKLYTAALGQKA